MTTKRFPCLFILVLVAFLAAAQSKPIPLPSDLLVSKAKEARDPSDAVAVLTQGLPSLKDPVQKKSVLLELASLEEFLGMYGEAAAHYSDASYLLPGEKDQRPLLSSISCRIRSGDLDRAEGELKAILLLAKNADIIAEARMLSVYTLFAGGKREEAFSFAKALIESDPGSKSLGMAKLLFMAVCTAETAIAAKPFKERLVRDFPGSPELLSAESFSSGHYGTVSPYPEPYWVFASTGLLADGFTETPVETKPPKEVENPASVLQAAESPGPAWFQTGSFSRRENAERLVAEMRKKGFMAEQREKKTGSGSFFIVVVPVGSSDNDTRLKLKDAGYEAYPVFD